MTRLLRDGILVLAAMAAGVGLVAFTLVLEGADMAEAPPARTNLVVEHKPAWADAWEEELSAEGNPSLRVAGPLRRGVGGTGGSQITLLRKYGPSVKYAPDASPTVPAQPLDWLDHWARVKLGTEVVWQGIIKADRRRVLRGADGEQRGHQRLICYGPEAILKRSIISTSFWSGVGGPWTGSDTDLVELGHILPMNYRGPGGKLEGNRGPIHAHADAGTYIYGLLRDENDVPQAPLWSHYHYLHYVLKEHVQAWTTDAGVRRMVGPTWSLAGDVDALNALDGLVTFLAMPPAIDALSLVRRLVPTSAGFDFAIEPTATGYQVRIFLLATEPHTFGTVTLPGNEATVEVSPTTDDHIVACEAELSSLQKVDHLEAIGERMVSCFSTPSTPQKRNLWSAAQEVAYLAGAGGADADANDVARATEAFRLVFQGFAFERAFDATYGLSFPTIDEEGNLTGHGAPRQNDFRRTLPTTPLLEGWDYTTEPPTRAAPQADEDAYRPPFAYVGLGTGEGYAMVDKLSSLELPAKALATWLRTMSVRILAREWGLLVGPHPNHALAHNHWSGAGATKFDPEAAGAVALDYDDLGMTIAVETDQRLRCYKDLEEPDRLEDGSRAVIQVPGAQLQYLAADTIVDIGSDGEVDRAPGDTHTETGTVLRNDNTRLHAIIAGAIARYLEDRFSATITWRDMTPRFSWLGKVLVFGDGEGALAGKKGVVTAVTVNQRTGRTTVKVGYAR